MSENKDFKAQAEEAVEKLKAAGAEAVNKINESGVIDKVKAAGEDVLNKVNESGVVEKVKGAVMGEDGKFDKDDLTRLGNQAADAAKDAVGKIKGFFSKEGE